MAVPATLTMRHAMLARIAATGVKTYDGRIPKNDPPAEIAGTDGLVAAYAVLHSGGGRAFSDRAVGGPSDLAWSPQVTVVAGAAANCLQAVDLIRAALTGTKLTIPDGSTGYLREPPGDRPLLVDKDFIPFRFYYPLVLQTVASP